MISWLVIHRETIGIVGFAFGGFVLGVIFAAHRQLQIERGER